jgi:hypothetical protein
MVRKSPDKQWNRQNSILFHETIPLMYAIAHTVLQPHSANTWSFAFYLRLPAILQFFGKVHFFAHLPVSV